MNTSIKQVLVGSIAFALTAMVPSVDAQAQGGHEQRDGTVQRSRPVAPGTGSSGSISGCGGGPLGLRA